MKIRLQSQIIIVASNLVYMLTTTCPLDFMLKQHEEFVFCYDKRVSRYLKKLITQLKEDVREVKDQLGLDRDNSMGTIKILLVTGPKQLKEATHLNYPEWTLALSIPAQELIILPVTGRYSSVDLDTVLKHELTHIFIYKSTGGVKIPRWFNEGLSVYVSGELLLERVKLLFKAVNRNNIIPLKELEDKMPQSHYKANIAYAESADFISYLYRKGGKYRIRGLLLRTKKENDFYIALQKVFGIPISELERKWVEELLMKYSYLPILTSATTFWIFMLFLLILAYIRNVRENKRRINEMEDGMENSLEDTSFYN